MTLLTTEIHQHESLNALIVFAADRRISCDGFRDSEQPKIFQVPRLRAGIGYYGLAEVPSTSVNQPMAEWLQLFLGSTVASTIGNLAQELTAALNTVVPDYWRRTERSGFHLCGFSSADRPEFWYIRNVDDTQHQSPTGLYECREDFQGRDVLTLPVDSIQIYRNGDIRAHVTAWQRIDDMFGGLLRTPGFLIPATPTEYENWVQFKMEVIADFYERFSKESIIGRPVDVFSISR